MRTEKPFFVNAAEIARTAKRDKIAATPSLPPSSALLPKSPKPESLAQYRSQVSRTLSCVFAKALGGNELIPLHNEEYPLDEHE